MDVARSARGRSAVGQTATGAMGRSMTQRRAYVHSSADFLIPAIRGKDQAAPKMPTCLNRSEQHLRSHRS